MQKIDIINWKEFVIGDLFDIHPTKSYKMTNKDLLNGYENNNPVIVNSAYNNGIGGYTTFDCTEKGNIITFSDTVDANTIFYQENDFVGYPHVQGVYPFQPELWNKERLLFFISMFKAEALRKGFNFGNKFRRDIAIKMKIKLPIEYNGNIDFIYMENYIKQVIKKSEKSLENLKRDDDSKQQIDVHDWGEFQIKNIFEVVKGTRLTKANMKDGNIKFVGSSAMNNGETHRIANNEHLHSANTITVCYNGSVGETFYQDEEFWASDDVNVLYPKFKLNKYIAFFICPIIKSVGQKYAFVDKWKQEDMKTEIIKLPITQTGEPDWQYMENYMKNIISTMQDNLTLFQAA